jgi:hypothetical protein
LFASLDAALYSQCFNIDTTKIPFTQNWFGAAGFFTDGTHPSFMRTRYIQKLSFDGSERFKLTFRMKINSLESQMYCFGKCDGTFGWYVSYNINGNGYVEFFNDVDGLVEFYPLNDTDYHIYTLDYDNGTMAWSVDAYSGLWTASTSFGYPNTKTTFCVGHRGAPNSFGSSQSGLPSPSQNYFRGYFDYIEIKSGNTPETFLWSFNEGAGEIAHDSATYKDGELGYPGYGAPLTNHLMNGCTWNYDEYNITWDFASLSLTTKFVPVGDGFKKWHLNDTWEPTMITGMTVWNNVLVATGVSSRINANDIYHDNGDSAKDIAYYNPNVDPPWNDLDVGLFGPGFTNDIGECVTVYNNKLIAIGSFQTAGAYRDTVNNIAQLDSINGHWRSLETGFTEPDAGRSCIGWSARVWDGNLYAGGTFHKAGGKICNYVAKWNDSTWSDLDDGTNNDVTCFEVYDSVLFVGGGFTQAGSQGDTYNHIAIWNGTNWTWPAGQTGANGWVSAMCVYNSELYVAGSFTVFNGDSCNGLVKYNGSTWTAVGSGPTGFGHAITAMTVFNGELYLTGSFLYMNGIPCYDICKYNSDGGFCAISNGLEQAGKSLVVYNDELYVGGNFYSGDGVYGSNILKYVNNNDDNFRFTQAQIPINPHLNQNYPNPFNPSTNIKYILPYKGLVKIVLYDILGREVKILVNEYKNAGNYNINFNGSNLASGVYFYIMLVNDSRVDSKKMVLLK